MSKEPKGKALQDLPLKEGDKVRCVSSESPHNYAVGEEFIVQKGQTQPPCFINRFGSSLCGHYAALSLALDGLEKIADSYTLSQTCENEGVVARYTLKAIRNQSRTEEAIAQPSATGGLYATWEIVVPVVWGPWVLVGDSDPLTDIAFCADTSEDKEGNTIAYRLPHSPVVEKVERYWESTKNSIWVSRVRNFHTHKITYNTIDGEIDCSSVIMEKL